MLESIVTILLMLILSAVILFAGFIILALIFIPIIILLGWIIDLIF